jgi:hypothetical protein
MRPTLLRGTFKEAYQKNALKYEAVPANTFIKTLSGLQLRQLWVKK